MITTSVLCPTADFHENLPIHNTVYLTSKQQMASDMHQYLIEEKENINFSVAS